jgi:hypothetical protein
LACFKWWFLQGVHEMSVIHFRVILFCNEDSCRVSACQSAPTRSRSQTSHKAMVQAIPVCQSPGELRVNDRGGRNLNRERLPVIHPPLRVPRPATRACWRRRAGFGTGEFRALCGPPRSAPS